MTTAPAVAREPEVALVLSADEWVDALHRHCADHGGVRVRLLVLDPVVALDEAYDVLVTSDRWPALTRPFVEGLHARGRRVLVVGDEPGASDLAHLVGADRVLSPEVPVTALVMEVVRLAPATPRPDPPAAAPAGPAEEPAATAPVVAVGGPFGAGSTEVALALAASWARRGLRPALVDADEVTPSLAARLGLPVEPNLCTAVDAVAFGLGAVPGALFDLGPDWPAVLVGAPNRASAAALRPADVTAVGAVLAARFAPVVFDVSAGARTVHGDPDVGAAVLRQADVVVAVGVANPVGVVRLVEWLEEAARVAPEAARHAVVNRAPTSRTRRAELAGEVQRGQSVAGCTFVPADPRVDEASWGATVVARGPFARAVEALGRDVAAAFWRPLGEVGG